MAGVPKESEEEAKSTFYYPPEKPVEKLPPKPVEQPVAIPKDKTLKLPPKPVEKPSEKLPREEGGRDAVVTGAGAVAGNGHMFNHNFFKAKERLTKKEIQGVILDQAFRFLPTRSNIYSEIVRSKREELLMSKIAFQLHKKVVEKGDQAIILDITGKPTRYYDGLEFQKLVELYAEEAAWQVLGGTMKGTSTRGNGLFIFLRMKCWV